MLKNKKLIVIIMIVLLLCIALIIAVLFFFPNFSKKTQNIINNIGQNIVEGDAVEEELENNFLNLFSDIDYLKEDQEIVSTVYEYQKEVENKYEVNVHIPKINFETCQDINDEILETFGRKLLNIVQESQEFTKYNVDYISYTHEGIISLIIKGTLKEGSNPQRVIIKTYNYYINEERLLTLDEVLNNKGLDKQKIQEKINNIIRTKNVNAKDLAEQGYNIYVRNTNSSEYEIDNIENFYINNEGNLYIIFAYGNKSFTETIDIIKIK